MNSTQAGLTHLARGEFDQAVAAFWTAVQSPGDDSPWQELGVTLALAGRWADLASLLNASDEAVPYLTQICRFFMKNDHYGLLDQMRDSLPETAPAYPVTVYFAGVSAIARGDRTGSLEHFTEFKRLLQANPAYYDAQKKNAYFYDIYRHSALVEPLSYLAALDDGSVPVAIPEPEVEWHLSARPRADEVLFCSAMNDLYFLRFSDGLVQTLEEACGPVALHLHVLGDQADVLDAFRDLVARYPNISLGLTLERRPPLAHAVYYTCSRFVILPHLLAAYGRNAVVLDGDSLVKSDLVQLVGRLSPGCDFACFEYDNVRQPGSVYDAACLYFAQSRGARDFLRLLQRYIFAKLDPPLWTLDQAALLVVSLYMESRTDRHFNFQRFNRLCDLAPVEMIADASSQAVKAKIRVEGCAV